MSTRLLLVDRRRSMKDAGPGSRRGAAAASRPRRYRPPQPGAPRDSARPRSAPACRRCGRRVAQGGQQHLLPRVNIRPRGSRSEQGDVEVLLQALDLVADRGLRDAQFDRRPGEAEMPGRGLEAHAARSAADADGPCGHPQIFLMASANYRRLQPAYGAAYIHRTSFDPCPASPRGIKSTSGVRTVATTGRARTRMPPGPHDLDAGRP